MKKILVIIGARPQFIKHSSFEIAAKKKFNIITLHTGQHYDPNMSEIFFDDLKMAKPNYLLNLGGGNHGFQTGNMMIEIEQIVEIEKPNAIVVYGDTNSTLAGALVASKLGITLVHIEAGLRSNNKEMPEEINRVLTDHISDLLFVPSTLAIENLIKEGITDEVFLVGDIMKDLVNTIISSNLLKRHDYIFPYYYATIHRPYNTDNEERIRYVLESLDKLSKKVVFSLHPRTKRIITNFGIKFSDYSNITFIEPQPYFNNLNYLFYSDGLITDSGGMQKEAYWLKKKCITIRKETEWIETIQSEGNLLLYDNLSEIDYNFSQLNPVWNDTLYGNGNSSEYIVDIIAKKLQ